MPLRIADLRVDQITIDVDPCLERYLEGFQVGIGDNAFDARLDVPLRSGCGRRCSRKTLPVYGEILGLPLVDQTPVACVFQANGTMLRVTTAERVMPAPDTVLGWAVHDIATTILPTRARRTVSSLRRDGPG